MKGTVRAISSIRNNVRLILVFYAFYRGREGGRGCLTVFCEQRAAILSELKRMKKPSTKSEIKKKIK